MYRTNIAVDVSHECKSLVNALTKVLRRNTIGKVAPGCIRLLYKADLEQLMDTRPSSLICASILKTSHST